MNVNDIAADWPQYLTPGDAVKLAAVFGVNIKLTTLANWRSSGRINGAEPPEFFKARGGDIVYPREAFVAWCVDERGPLVRRTAELMGSAA